MPTADRVCRRTRPSPSRTRSPRRSTRSSIRPGSADQRQRRAAAACHGRPSTLSHEGLTWMPMTDPDRHPRAGDRRHERPGPGDGDRAGRRPGPGWCSPVVTRAAPRRPPPRWAPRRWGGDGRPRRGGGRGGCGGAYERLGGVDVLVNNAGIGMRTVNPRFMTDPQSFWEVSPDGFRDVRRDEGHGTVSWSPVRSSPRMLDAGGGRIVIISMNEQTMTRPGFVPYGPVRRRGGGARAGDGRRPRGHRR